jgi:hypothetical protein
MKQHPLSIFLSVLLLAASINIASAAAEELLDNNSIIELQQLELGDEIVIGKIKTTKGNFDTSISGLRQLRDAKISPGIISAMIAAKAQEPAKPINTIAKDSGSLNDPLSPHPNGLWVLQVVDGVNKMTQLEAEGSVETSSGGFISPYGGKVSQTVRLNGAHADLQLSDIRPIFYFYVGHDQGGGNEFTIARSARQFTLAQFTITKDNDRALEVGSQGAYGGSSGIARKALRDFAVEKVAGGIFKITPNTALPIGEYTFCRAMARGQGEFFPFSIRITVPAGSASHDEGLNQSTSLLNADRAEDVIEALNAIQARGATEAVPAIVPVLKNPNAAVVIEACRVLSVLGSKANIPALRELVDGPINNLKLDGPSLSIAAQWRRSALAREVRQAAKEAIKILEAKPQP